MYSHTLEGLFWFDLPLGLLLAFIFHNIVRDPLIEASPAFLRARFACCRELNWNGYFMKNCGVVGLSVLVGAASHVLWDSFTHPGGYFVEAIPALSQKVSFLTFHFPVLKVLQHLSTLLGGLVIMYAIWQLPIEYPSSKKPNPLFWILIVLFTLITVGLRLLVEPELAIGNLIVTTIAGALLGIALVSLWQGRRRLA